MFILFSSEYPCTSLRNRLSMESTGEIRPIVNSQVPLTHHRYFRTSKLTFGSWSSSLFMASTPSAGVFSITRAKKKRKRSRPTITTACDNLLLLPTSCCLSTAGIFWGRKLYTFVAKLPLSTPSPLLQQSFSLTSSMHHSCYTSYTIKISRQYFKPILFGVPPPITHIYVTSHIKRDHLG